MNMKHFVQLFVLAALVFAAPVNAVTRYSCNFEDSVARSRWKINPTANQNIYNQLANKWYIGEPGNNDRNGQYGLYISDDGGQTAHYAKKGCWVFAYDTISLDHITGDYTLVFDYTAMGNVASNFDGLYVLWIPMVEPGTTDSVKVLCIPTSSGTIPSTYENYVVRLQPTAGMDYLNGTATWRQCAVKIKGSKCDGTPHYLAFVWANGGNQPQQPGGMVDNISISDNMPCDPVTGLTVTPNGTTVNLQWNASGSMTDYEVSAYSYETGTWSGPKLVNGTQTSFTGLPVGQTDFIVRTKCSDLDFSLKTIVSKLIYYPDQMCVDYLNLNNAVCYVDNLPPGNTLTFNDFKQVAPVDLGPSNINSRHVVHFDRTETEPRTGGMAKTVPDGELASVRLGNWDADDHAERIEFTFDVDTIKYPVLLLKYMPLLEAPGHADYENPRFKLDILIDGVTIGECGQADFNANNVMNGNQLKPEAVIQGWHLTPSSVSQTSADIVWKDWTTVGVNLKKKEYAGKQITARLTTHDCTFSVHCGYAYFTLGCSDGKLKGMKCGAINPKFEAPDGFDYRWAYAYNEKYRRPDGSLPEQYIVHRGKFYDAGYQDDSLYVVDCMFVQDSTCFFSLYASTLATNPISVMNKPQVYMNCRDSIYQVTFDASPSWVQEIDHVTGDTLVSKAYHIETYEWNIEGLKYGWSDEVKPTFNFPLEGGDFDVSLRTTCGTCDSVLHYHLHLDPIGATKETQTYILCDDARKAGFEWKERTDTAYHTYGIVDSVVLTNPATTCDSVIYLELTEPLRIFEDTVVLKDNLPFVYRGRTYTETMVDTIPNELCDTTWVLNFEVYEPLHAHLADTALVVCEDDSLIRLEYIITQGRSLRYSYVISEVDSIAPQSKRQRKGTDTTLVVKLLPMPYPNVYNGSILLEDSLPEHNVRLPFTVTVNYASSIITQRWNDVLAIRNDSTIKQLMGGNIDPAYYTFSAVQWYLNGAPITGATAFNYFAGEGSMLQFDQEYTALLTRKSDGVKLFTCAFKPEKIVDPSVTDIPTLTLLPSGSQLQVKGKGKAYWYDMLGRPYHTESYDDSAITAPASAGYYLLLLQSDESREIHPIMVK